MTDRKPLISTIAHCLTVLALLGVLALQLVTRDEAQRDAAELRTTLLEPRYEYKVVIVAGSGHDRNDGDALKPSVITIDDKELSKLGGQGWEVVSSILELETAFPNLGTGSYVTGLQPNIRPQRVLLILRHRLG